MEGLLDLLRSVQRQAPPGDFTQVFAVAVGQRVAGDHHVRFLGRRDEGITAQALRPVMDKHAQRCWQTARFREPSLPTTEVEANEGVGLIFRPNGLGAFIREPAGDLGGGVVQQQGDELNHFAEAHVVRRGSRRCRGDREMKAQCSPRSW